MMATTACFGVGGRRVGGFVIGSSLPRQFALHSQVRLISTARIQRVGSTPLRKDLYALPGSSRSFWWSSSKTPSAPKTEPESAVQDASINNAIVSEQPPAETTTLVDPTNAADASLLSDSASLPDVPLDSISSAAVDAVSNVVATVPPPPLNYGDLAASGLGGWSPIGICQLGIEALQVFTGMPWFWTIVSVSFISRAVLVPFAVMGLRNAAKMAPHQPEFLAIREEMVAARASSDPLKMNRTVLKQKVLYEKIGVSFLGMFLPAVMQVPVTLGMFFGVKRMCDLPVEQLKYSGLDILPDLTIVDPTWTLPILATLAINAQLTLSAKDMTASNPTAGHMINLFRGLTVLGFFFMSQLPSGVLVYLVATSSFMCIQTALLRLPAIRRYLGIPEIPAKFRGKGYTMLESIKFARDSFQKKRAEAEQIARTSRRR